MAPKTLIIMPTYIQNDADLNMTWRTIETILATTDKSSHLTIIDDCSPYFEGRRGLWDKVNSYMHGDMMGCHLSILLQPDNKGFASTVNIGLNHALQHGSDAVLVNADMEFVYDGWLEALYEVDAAVVGGLLLFPNGLIQHAGIYYSILRRAYDHRFAFAPGDLPAAQVQFDCPVTGALQLIRYSTLEEIGVYDEEFKMGWEDVDYCLRVFLSGQRCVYQPAAKAIHHESAFRNQRDLKEWHRASYSELSRKYPGTDISFMSTMLNPA